MERNRPSLSLTSTSHELSILSYVESTVLSVTRDTKIKRSVLPPRAPHGSEKQ